MAAKTRAALQANIEAVLSDPELHSITAAQIMQLLTDINDSVFNTSEDAFSPAVDTLEITNPDGGLIMDGARMLTEIGAAVPSLGESPTTGEIRDAVNAIISRLSEHHGLIQANP